MSMNFKQAYNIVLKWEYGYVDHPDDPGGETLHGISKRAYPHLDIKNLNKYQIEAIYYKDYWSAADCHLMSNRMSLLLFSGSVQHGVKRAVKLLQKAAGTKSDGVIGPKTIAAVERVGDVEIAKSYTVRRILFYTMLKPWKIFSFGWMRRVIDVYTQAVEHDVRGN